MSEDQSGLKKLSQCVSLFTLREEVSFISSALIGSPWLCAFLGLDSHFCQHSLIVRAPQFSHAISTFAFNALYH